MAEEIIIGLFLCTFAEGGECSVPAGSRVVLGVGWAAKNRGLVQDFLQAQTTKISIDGATIDLSDSYSALERLPDGGFVSRIRHDTGVTLSAGESLQVEGELSVSHVVPDAVLDEVTHRQNFFRPEEPLHIHCRITASA
jgi:hypothetical protein